MVRVCRRAETEIFRYLDLCAQYELSLQYCRHWIQVNYTFLYVISYEILLCSSISPLFSHRFHLELSRLLNIREMYNRKACFTSFTADIGLWARDKPFLLYNERNRMQSQENVAKAWVAMYVILGIMLRDSYPTFACFDACSYVLVRIDACLCVFVACCCKLLFC